MPIPKEIRMMRSVLFAMYGHCHYCHERVFLEPTFPTFPRMATIDHLIPLVRGGSHHPSNLVLSCLECNEEKGDRTESQYRDWKRKQKRRGDYLHPSSQTPTLP